MHETGKCAQVIFEMQGFSLDILDIGEMKWNGYGKMAAVTGETILYSGKSDEVDHHDQEVELILSRRANNRLVEWEPISARIITARFNFKWRNVTVIQCYAPINSNEKETKKQFYEILQAVVHKVSSRDIAIGLGDMNAKVGCENTRVERGDYKVLSAK